MVMMLDNLLMHCIPLVRLGLICNPIRTITYLALCLVFDSSIAFAQQNQTTKPNPVQKNVSTPQKGIQVSQRQPNKTPAGQLQSKALSEKSPSLTDPGTEEYSQFDAAPDFRVQRGCMKRGFRESNLPTRIGIDNPEIGRAHV